MPIRFNEILSHSSKLLRNGKQYVREINILQAQLPYQYGPGKSWSNSHLKKINLSMIGLFENRL
jgi:hypothetical protein